jgi:hypothetical protein
MTEAEMMEAVELHRRWLASAPGGRQAVLRHVSMAGARLGAARLPMARLNGASLRGADLSGADLGRCDLRFADLREAKVEGASLVGADLRWSSLAGADLRGANFTRARLKGAVLDGARMNWSDRTLVSEILWRAAGDDVYRRMAAALVARQDDWCWDRFFAIPGLEQGWALHEVRRLIREGDDAPLEILATVEAQLAG